MDIIIPSSVLAITIQIVLIGYCIFIFLLIRSRKKNKQQLNQVKTFEEKVIAKDKDLQKTVEQNESLSKEKQQMVDELETVKQELQEQTKAFEEQSKELQEKSQALQGRSDLLEYLQETIKTIAEQFQEKFDKTIDASEADEPLSQEQAQYAIAYKTLLGHQKSIDSDNSPQDAFQNIQEDLNSVIEHLLPEDKDHTDEEFEQLAEQEEALKKTIAKLTAEKEAWQEKQEHLQKRIDSLETFKTMFFEMQEKLSDNKQRGEGFNQQIRQKAQEIQGGESIVQLSNDMDALFAEMSTMVGDRVDKEELDKLIEQGDTSAIIEMTFTKNQEEISNLRGKIRKQEELIKSLEEKLQLDELTQSEKEELIKKAQELNIVVRDSQMCIDTLEIELDSMQAQVRKLHEELDKLGHENESLRKSEILYNNSVRETQEMMDCIAVLENETTQQKKEIIKLKTALVQATQTGPKASEMMALQQELQEAHNRMRKQELKYAELEIKYLKEYQKNN